MPRRSRQQHSKRGWGARRRMLRQIGYAGGHPLALALPTFPAHQVMLANHLDGGGQSSSLQQDLDRPRGMPTVEEWETIHRELSRIRLATTASPPLAVPLTTPRVVVGAGLQGSGARARQSLAAPAAAAQPDCVSQGRPQRTRTVLRSFAQMAQGALPEQADPAPHGLSTVVHPGPSQASVQSIGFDASSLQSSLGLPVAQAGFVAEGRNASATSQAVDTGHASSGKDAAVDVATGSIAGVFTNNKSILSAVSSPAAAAQQPSSPFGAATTWSRANSASRVAAANSGVCNERSDLVYRAPPLLSRPPQRKAQVASGEHP